MVTQTHREEKEKAEEEESHEKERENVPSRIACIQTLLRGQGRESWKVR